MTAKQSDIGVCGGCSDEGCGQKVSYHAESCPHCGFPIGRQLDMFAELIRARDDQGLTQIPRNVDLQALNLADLESWVAWVRAQTQTTTLACPRCGSTWVNVPESFGQAFKRGAVIGFIAGLFNMGVLAEVDDGAYSCSNCAYRWTYK
jgi:predicted RNA-binding Zn-ribbon protein involved in translation (DUF1610 family)